jgi:hypothetical protein
MDSEISLEAQSVANSSMNLNEMDVYVEMPKEESKSDSDVETPTLQVPDTTKPSSSDLRGRSQTLSSVHSSASSRTTTSTISERDFKTHASFRASNPFALDAGIGGWTRSPTPSGSDSPAHEMIKGSSSGGEYFSSSNSMVQAEDVKGAESNDDSDSDEEEESRRNEMEERLLFTQIDQVSPLSRLEGGASMIASSSQDSFVSANESMATSSSIGMSKLTMGEASKNAKSSGLASQLRARLASAANGGQRSHSDWSSPSPSSSSTATPLAAPARPAKRRIDSERYAAKQRSEGQSQMISSQSEPVMRAANSQESDEPLPEKRISLPPTQKEAVIQLGEPVQTSAATHTLSDIYSVYGKSTPQHDDAAYDGVADEKDEQARRKAARRSFRVMKGPGANPYSFEVGMQEVPPIPYQCASKGSQKSLAGDVGLHKPQEGIRSQASAESMGDTSVVASTENAESISGSLLSYATAPSEPDQILMTPIAGNTSQFVGSEEQDQFDDHLDEPAWRHEAVPSSSYNEPMRMTGIPKQQSEPEPDANQTSVGATVIARRQRAFTLRGEMEMDLTSARNPVPIRFLLGNDKSERLQQSKSNTPSTDDHALRQDIGTTQDKENINSPPATAFFPKIVNATSTTSFTRMEVPLPLHQSPSSQSIANAYRGVNTATSPTNDQFVNGAETTSTIGQIRNSVRKRSLSLKRSQPQLRVETDIAPPPIPLARVKSEKAGLPSLKPAPETSKMPAHASSPPPHSSSARIRHFHSNSLFGGRPKFLRADSNSEASPVSSKDYFKTERYNDTPFTMSDSLDSRKNMQAPLEETDEWGFRGNSPVPAIFSNEKPDPKHVSKLEQNLVSNRGSLYHTQD